MKSCRNKFVGASLFIKLECPARVADELIKEIEPITNKILVVSMGSYIEKIAGWF